MVYGCHDVSIILRQQEFKKLQSTNTFHNERKKVFESMFLESKREEKNQMMKLKTSRNVNLVYMTSFTFLSNWSFIS